MIEILLTDQEIQDVERIQMLTQQAAIQHSRNYPQPQMPVSLVMENARYQHCYAAKLDTQ